MPEPKMSQNAQQAYDEALRRIEECRKLGERGTFLDLGGFGLTTLPPEIGQLQALRVLDLHGNLLSTLPPEIIGQLQALTRLDLSNNMLSSLPPEIGNLTALTGLSLDNNDLTKLPPKIGQLTALRELYLERNQLTTLPTQIVQLTTLKELSLYGNQLTTLPPEIGQLTALTRLHLDSNLIITLPETMRKLVKLECLFLHGNPDLELPAEVLGPTWIDVSRKNATPADPRVILDYYFRLKQGRKPLHEFKLILVGRGGTGKTALVNRLMGRGFIPTDMTRGIHIEPWEVRAGNDDVTAHVWDFGGQDIMHGTHQFFLTQRSLYVLVLAARESKQNEDAEYWLKTISAFGGQSPVIVVLNKSAERPFDVNENALLKKYPSIQAFIRTDCQTGLGMEELQAAISRAADKLDGLRDAFPAAWFAVKKRLSGMRENFLSYDEFRRKCAELGEMDEKEQDALAGVLHVLGIALNFRDDERLRETSVLNPLWVTRGIYSLLNDNELAKRHGELRMADFARVLAAEDYPKETHGFLLELMCKFELCFPLAGAGAQHLIPELLSPQEPDEAGPLDTNEALAFTYFYPKMLPHGLVPRFIVRLYQLIEGNLRWRTGAVLQWIDARALVKADEDERCIRIRVRGSAARSRELLGIIRQEFDVLHRQFHGLLPREVIQLPNYPEVAVDYSHVEAAARAGMKRMPIFSDGNMIQVDPDALLKEFEVEGEERDAGNRGAKEVEPVPPPHHRRRSALDKEGSR